MRGNWGSGRLSKFVYCMETASPRARISSGVCRTWKLGFFPCHTSSPEVNVSFWPSRGLPAIARWDIYFPGFKETKPMLFIFSRESARDRWTLVNSHDLWISIIFFQSPPRFLISLFRQWAHIPGVLKTAHCSVVVCVVLCVVLDRTKGSALRVCVHGQLEARDFITKCLQIISVLL